MICIERSTSSGQTVSCKRLIRDTLTRLLPSYDILLTCSYTCYNYQIFSGESHLA